MRSVNDLARFLTALCLIFLFYSSLTHKAEDNLNSLVFLFPMVILPVVGLMVWANTLKLKKHVAVPGFYWACLVILSVLVPFLFDGARTIPRVMSALTAILPCLLLPILFQGMVSSRDRRGLRSLMIALLVITLIHVVVQSFVTSPNLAALYKEQPQLMMEQLGIDPYDKYAQQDLQARLNSTLFGSDFIHDAVAHFKTSNILAIVLLLMAAFARSIKKNGICIVALVVMFLFCQSKGIILIFLLTLPLTRRRPNAIRALVLGAIASLVFWQEPVGQYVIDQIRGLDEPLKSALKSVEFRVSYWMTAEQMNDYYGPVGLGQYPEFANAARVDGGHYASMPHNGFLKLVAEIGLLAAVAAFIWLAGLVRGPSSKRKEGGAPRASIFWGAFVALSTVMFLPTSYFDFGYRFDGSELHMRWPVLVYAYRLGLLALFAIVWWKLQKKIWKVGNGSLIFAATALALHQFMEMDLSEPAILMIFFVIVSISRMRQPVDNSWKWHFMPLLCLMCVGGVLWVQSHQELNPTVIFSKIRQLDSHIQGLKIDQQAAQLTNEFKNENDAVRRQQIQVELSRLKEKRENFLVDVERFGSDPNVAENEKKQQLLLWHDIQPFEKTPIQVLLAMSEGEERVKWATAMVATEQADPVLHYRLAQIYQLQGYPGDVVLNRYKRAEILHRKKLLPRYGLSKEQRKDIKLQQEHLATRPQN